MKIYKPASTVSQQITSFKNNGYSHLDASPYPEGLTLKEVKDRTEMVISLLPKAVEEASDRNGWKTDDRYDPPTDQVAAQIERKGKQLQLRRNLTLGSVAAMGLGVTGGVLTATSVLPQWVGAASAVAGSVGLGYALWQMMDLQVYSAKEVQQAAQDLRAWGTLP